MINKYTNKQRGLLAVIMAMVMVFAGAAFVAAEVDATGLPAASSDGVITLDADTTVDEDVDITSSVTINLNGNKLTLNDVGIWVHGTPNSIVVLTITGEGEIERIGSTSTKSTIYVGRAPAESTSNASGYASLIMSGAQTITTPTYGITVWNNSTIELNGTIITAYHSAVSGNGYNTSVKADLKNVDVTSTNGNGIYWPSTNELTIRDSAVTGLTGIYAKCGTINILDGTEITGTGTASGYTYSGNGGEPTGDAFVIDSCAYPGGIPKVNIGDATFNSNDATGIGMYLGNGVDSYTDAKITGNVLTKGMNGVQGTSMIVEGAVTNTGDEGSFNAELKVSSGATVSGVAADKIEYNAGTGQFEFGDTLNSDYTVTKDEYLSNNLTIPEGVTLTIADGGVLNMAGNNITVLGSFVVEIGGTLASVAGTETVFLIKGCTFDNSGMIGYGQSVNVSAETDEDAKYVGMGSVSMSGISGVEFDIVNTGEKNGNNEAIYTLTVSGDFYTENDSATITLNDVRVVGETYIGNDIIVVAENVVLMGNATLTIDGTLDASFIGSGDEKAFIMKNKSTIVDDGIIIGTIIAETGDFATSSGYISLTNNNSTSITFPAVTPLNDEGEATAFSGMTGITLSVGTVSYQEKVQGVNTAMTSQRLYVSGDVGYVTAPTTGDPSTLIALGVTGNKIYIAEGDEVALKAKMALSNVVVQGKLVAESADLSTITGYTGTAYTITVTTPSRNTTLYIEPFTAALVNIDAADKKTLNVCEKVKIDGALTLTEGQIIINNGEIKVSKTGNLVLEAKSKINNNAVASVEGILKVMKGASCDEPSNYATLVKNNEYVQYSGLQVALDSAVEGDTITIANETTVSKGDLVIPAGVTVIATEDITVSEGDVDVLGKLVLEDGAVLAVAGEDATITVPGELDASEGDISIADGSLTSTGTTIVTPTAALGGAEVNGVCYYDDDANIVITSAQKAIDAEASKDVPGTVLVSGNVSADNLNVDADITIAVDAVFKVGNAFISEGKKVDLTNGKTTGSFSASTGVEETTTGALTTSTISFTDAYGIVIGEGDVVDSMNVKTHVLYVYGDLKGKMTVDVGTATVGYDSFTTLAVESDDSPYVAAYMEVADGATLDIADGMTLTVGTVGEVEKTAAVVVKGTISVAGDITNNGILAIDGQMIVSDENGLTLTGTVELDGDLMISTTEDKEAVVELTGKVFVTSTGSIAGAIDIDDSDTAYIQVLDGADISAALINYDEDDKESDALSTAFYINGDLYMTVYAIGDVTISSVLDATEFVVPGYVTDDMNDETKWFLTDKYDASKVPSASTTVSKDVPAVYFKAVQAEVIGTISVGSGLTLYIDGLSINNFVSETGGKYDLTVGTHTVTYDVLSGYDGSNAVITFNGATVSGGSITIDADAESFVLSINGAVPMANQPVVIEPAEDDGMALTDILLIVLVVLIVIMAIIVALRMMRS